MPATDLPTAESLQDMTMLSPLGLLHVAFFLVLVPCSVLKSRRALHAIDDLIAGDDREAPVRRRLQPTLISSTWKTSVAFGPMTGGAPRAP